MKTKTSISCILYLALILFPFTSYCQSTLSPGDIAFIGFDSDSPDAFSFIVLNSISQGTSINFTDNGWESNNTLTTNEGHIKWIAPTGGVSPGDIICISYESTWISSKGLISPGGGSLNLSADGDQILAYQVSTDTSFIATIHFNGNDWNTSVTTTNESVLPAGLTNNLNALAINEDDNAIFAGKLNGTQSELLSKINNPANWFGSSTYYFSVFEYDYPYNIWVSTSAEWSNASKWFTNIVPDMYDHAYIQGTRDPFISSSTKAVCKKLTLASNSSITFKSDINGTASLLCNEVTVEPGVLIYTERYLPSSNWHLISSPVYGQELAAFGGSVGNSIVVYTDSEPDEYNLASYNESTDDWSYVQVGSAGTFEKGKGYSVQRTTSGVVTFSGTGIFTGNQNVAISGTVDMGWNLIGNPYTSSIDANLFLNEVISEPDITNKSKLDGSFRFIYLWDQMQDDYTQTTTGNVALGQGFFVNSAEGGGTINFAPVMQTSSAAEFKSSETAWPTVKLIARANDLYNETVINFNSNMTIGLDPGYDAGKLKGNPNIALYTKLIEDNGVDFAIQSLPDITSEIYRIPVGLDFVPGGEISFMVETENMPAGSLVYFEDMQSGAITQLNEEDARYSVTLGEKAKGFGRFYLTVSKSSTTDIEGNYQPSMFTIFNRENIIFINGPANDETTIMLYSIDGKIWASRQSKNQKSNKIDATTFPAGIYILRVKHLGNYHTEKLVLSKQ